jgi:hypothetical protein
MTIAEIDRRIAKTKALLVRANGEYYIALLGDLAFYRALRARAE